MKGSVRVRNGTLYAVISYKDNLGQYKQKWISTGLKERGNKKQAQKILETELEKFTLPHIEENPQPAQKNDIIFIDYIYDYIKSKEKELSPNVYQSYMECWKIMKKHFGNKLKLKDVTYHHIEDYYDYLKNTRKNKNITIKHHAVILSPALRLAYRDDFIAKNPYEFMPKIKKEKSKMQYYNKEELEKLFEVTDKSPLKLIVRVAAYYGFRRSELVGLKWDAIDFKNKMITIKHKVLHVNNKFYLSDTLKTTASHRILPLLPEIESLLIERKEEIEKNKELFKKSYNHKYDEYVFVDDIGDLINPDIISNRFRTLLRKNNLKHVRFHDLRHSCASLLVASKVPMKNIQEWLGHSNFNTTADVYSHLDYSSKYESANALSKALSFDKTEEKQSEEEIDDDIEKLEKLLEEKKKLKQKKKDFEM
ncbi:MAG TPA: site-specific integrase [Candidatus Caccovivens faecavium]|nr:site-specific integrase [Candidatus Caccovivens faecavium]